MIKIAIGLTAIIIVVLCYYFAKLIRLWLTHNFSDRVPYIISLLLYEIIMSVLFVQFFLSYHSELFVIMTQVYLIVVHKNIISSKLQGYITVNMTKIVQMNLLTVYNICYTWLLFHIVINFQYDRLSVPMNLLQIFNHKWLTWMYIPFVLFIFLGMIFLIWFESHDDKSLARIHAIFIIPVLTSFMKNDVNPIVKTLSIICYFLYPLIIAIMETNSIYKHVQGINATSKEVDKILASIAKGYSKNGKHTHRDLTPKMIYQMNYITKMLRGDKTLRDYVFRHH